MHWDYIYEEELFDGEGCWLAGVISNGRNFLFFTIGCDGPGAKKICRVYNSILFSPETLECKYEWCERNDRTLFDCLNASDEQNFCGEDGRLRNLSFISHE